MAKSRSRGDDESIVSPFIVQVDTREQRVYEFQNIKANVSQGSKIISVRRHRKTIRNGDYTIVGMEPTLGVERKSKEDLYGSVGRRENFERRLARMDDVRRQSPASYFAVVVEAELSDCLCNPPVHSRLHPKSLNRTILAWRQRYAVDWFFLPGREFAEQYTYRILERFWLDHFAEHPELAPSFTASEIAV